MDALEDALTAAGIKVWRDKNDLMPGGDWRQGIREAITKHSLAFVVCFSEHSAARDSSYQYEELLEAIEVFRLRPPQRPWMFPVRFADVEPPSYDLGAGRDLNTLHRADLFGDRSNGNLIRLVQAVGALLDTDTGLSRPLPSSAPAQGENVLESVRRLLRDPNGDIVLENFVNDELDDVLTQLERLADTTLPTADSLDAAAFMIDRIKAVDQAMDPIMDLLVEAGLHSRPEHDAIWTGMAEAVASAANRRTGSSVLIMLNRYCIVLMLYAVGVAAVARKNFAPLRAVAVDAQVADLAGRRPLIGSASARSILESVEWVGTALVRSEKSDRPAREVIAQVQSERGGKLFTPMSEHLHAILRPRFRRTIRDDAAYTQTFDLAEILIDLIAVDVEQHSETFSSYLGAGCYTWRNKYDPAGPLAGFERVYGADPAGWPFAAAGLFDGDSERASAAWQILGSWVTGIVQSQR